MCQKRLGLKLKERSKDSETSCFICNGKLLSLKSLSNEIVTKLKDYEFETFLIGASVPHEILDNEDELRARFKIKGKDGIKSQITKMLSQEVRLATKKVVNYAKPDLTVLASLSENSISISLKSIWMSGRYVKLVRGLPQRSGDCPICTGLGCAQCNYRGRSADSVQSRISDYLTTVFSAEDCSFIWLGSEDEKSLVKGKGRLFFVEIIKPRKRFALNDKLVIKKNRQKRSRTFYRSREIQIKDLKMLDRRMADIPQFEIVARVILKKNSLANPLDQSEIQSLEDHFRNCLISVRLSRKFRTVEKGIRSIKVTSLEDGERMELEIHCDGGIPIKKLVTGQDGTVQPNLANFFSSRYEIDKAMPFDILDVEVKEGKEHSRKNRFSENSEAFESEFEE